MSKGTKRLTTTVTAQTHYHLYRLAAMAGYSSPAASSTSSCVTT